MSSNSTKTATTTRTASRASSGPLRRRSTGSAKNANNGITSESIAADLAAFRKQGGRVEVLGNTPIRPRVNATAFRSRGNTARKAATKTAGTGTKG